jgi:hypothetical protein
MPGPGYLAVAIAIAVPGPNSNPSPSPSPNTNTDTNTTSTNPNPHPNPQVPGLWLQRRARLKAKEPKSSSRGSKRSLTRSQTSGLPDEARVVHEEGL